MTPSPPAGARLAVVSGGRSGIGRSIVARLTTAGYLPVVITSTADSPPPPGGLAIVADLATPDGPERAASDVVATGVPVGVLVHCAGVIRPATVAGTTATDVDHQLSVNLRAPMLLTRGVLPSMDGHSDIVVINSSAARSPAAGNSVYAASKAGLAAFTESLRAEVNPLGVRVVTIWPGRVATPLQERLYAADHVDYAPELLIQPEEVADMVWAALSLPRTVEVTDIHLRPALRSY